MEEKLVNIQKEKGSKKKLSCSYRTYEIITQDCVEEFFRHHPELKGMTITHNLILRRIAEFYIKT